VKYSINFYLDELKPKVYYLTLKNTLLAVLAVAVLIMGWKLLLDSQVADDERRVKVVQQQLSSAKSNLAQLQEDLVKHNDKATFNKQKQILQKNLEAKKMLWEGVGKRLEASTVNYFTVMDELTKLHEENIWLSSFDVSEDRAIFRGYALDSSSVTRWMTQLQLSQSFKGREFSHLNIKVHDEQSLTFELATEELKGEDLLQFAPLPSASSLPSLDSLPVGVLNNG